VTRTLISLPVVPPSVNRIWRHGSGRTYRIPAYTKWLNTMGLIAKGQMRGQPTWDVPVKVEILMRRPRKNSDVDNRIKAVLDLLQAIGVIANDNLVMGIKADWSDEVEAVWVEVTGAAA
jgi:Holliday junction resolvase RusA-like endonuclease